MSSNDNNSNESIESNPEETTKKPLESSSKSNENNKTQIKTEKQKSIIPNDRTTGTYKKGNRKAKKGRKKHFNGPEENIEGHSTKSKDNAVEFSYEKFPKKSNKESLDGSEPHQSPQKRGIDSHHSKRHMSTDLQEAPSLKYKKITYLSVVDGKSFHK